MKIKCFTESQIKDLAEKYKDAATRIVNNLLYFNNKENCINIPYKVKDGVKFVKWTYNYFANKEATPENTKQSSVIQSIAELMASYELMNPSIKFIG